MRNARPSHTVLITLSPHSLDPLRVGDYLRMSKLGPSAPTIS
jgi:hypothetical protein